VSVQVNRSWRQPIEAHDRQHADPTNHMIGCGESRQLCGIGSSECPPPPREPSLSAFYGGVGDSAHSGRTSAQSKIRSSSAGAGRRKFCETWPEINRS